jgi:hypothetical protein
MGHIYSHNIIDGYIYNIKAYESQDDYIHDNYVICSRIYIPLKKIEVNIHKNNINVICVKSNRLEELVKDKNIYNIQKVKLKKNFINNIMQYYKLQKQQQDIFSIIEYTLKGFDDLIKSKYDNNFDNNPNSNPDNNPDNKFEEVSLL